MPNLKMPAMINGYGYYKFDQEQGDEGKNAFGG